MSELNVLDKIKIDIKSKDAVDLVKTLLDAMGIPFKPFYNRLTAVQEAKNLVTFAKANAEVLAIEDDANLVSRAKYARQMREEKEYANLENIALGAIPHLKPEARPRELDEDWVNAFKDKASKKSNPDIQKLWSKILAGEANQPNSYSLKTLDILSNLSQADAELFVNLCRFVVFHKDKKTHIPLIFDTQHKIYNDEKIDFDSLIHLQFTALIQFFENGWGNILSKDTKEEIFDYSYYNHVFQIKIDKNNEFIPYGDIKLTAAGLELYKLAADNLKPVPGFVEYVVGEWKKRNPNVTLEDISH